MDFRTTTRAADCGTRRLFFWDFLQAGWLSGLEPIGVATPRAALLAC